MGTVRNGLKPCSTDFTHVEYCSSTDIIYVECILPTSITVDSTPCDPVHGWLRLVHKCTCVPFWANTSKPFVFIIKNTLRCLFFRPQHFVVLVFGACVSRSYCCSLRVHCACMWNSVLCVSAERALHGFALEPVTHLKIPYITRGNEGARGMHSTSIRVLNRWMAELITTADVTTAVWAQSDCEPYLSLVRQFRWHVCATTVFAKVKRHTSKHQL